MMMDENLSKAVGRMGSCTSTLPVGNKMDWQTIRAHLVELEAENERLQAQLDAGTEAGWHALWNERDELQSRLAAADALLRKCRDEFARLPHSLGYDFTHLPEIDAHLSEDGHG